jgi:hypothetical protein
MPPVSPTTAVPSRIPSFAIDQIHEEATRTKTSIGIRQLRISRKSIERLDWPSMEWYQFPKFCAVFRRPWERNTLLFLVSKVYTYKKAGYDVSQVPWQESRATHTWLGFWGIHRDLQYGSDTPLWIRVQRQVGPDMKLYPSLCTYSDFIIKSHFNFPQGCWSENVYVNNTSSIEITDQGLVYYDIPKPSKDHGHSPEWIGFHTKP